MSPEIFNQYKNLFLLFSPGCGGNHLANMLSLHPAFEPRFKSDDYEKEVYRKYIEYFDMRGRQDCIPVAHFSDLENLRVEFINKHKETILKSTKKYIFCAHIEEYFHQRAALIDFTDRFFILFSIPKINTILLKRLENNSSWYHRKTLLDYKPMKPESYELIDSIEYGIPENSIFKIDSDLFYSFEGFDYIQGELNTNFGITLPKMCKELHYRYISTQKIIAETFDKIS